MDLSEFRPKLVDWVGAVAPALKAWGVEEREADIIIDKVMRVFMDQFSLRLLEVEFKADKDEIKLKVSGGFGRLYIEIIQSLNGINTQSVYGERFEPTKISQIFFRTFALEGETKSGITLKRKKGMTNAKLIPLCSALVPSKYPPPRYEDI